MNKRNSNLELLRILAIIFIVSCHAFDHGVLQIIDLEKEQFSINIPISQFFAMLGNIGNSIFILLMGYFSFSSREGVYKQRTKKLFFLYVEYLFYSITICVISVIVVPEWVSFKQIIVSVFPLHFGSSWFISYYIVFSLFIPFFERQLNRAENKNVALLTCLCLLLFVIVPTLFGAEYLKQKDSLDRFFVLFVCGNMIHRLEFVDSKRVTNFRKKSITVAFITLILLFLSAFVIDYFGYNYSIKLLKYSRRFEYLFGFIISYCLVTYYASKDVRHNKLINALSSTSLGVYLISENEILWRHLWTDCFRCISYWNTKYYYPYMIAIIISTTVICMAIDLVRKKAFDSRIIQRSLDRIWSFIRKIFLGIYKFLLCESAS